MTYQHYTREQNIANFMRNVEALVAHPDRFESFETVRPNGVELTGSRLKKAPSKANDPEPAPMPLSVVVGQALAVRISSRRIRARTGPPAREELSVAAACWVLCAATALVLAFVGR